MATDNNSRNQELLRQQAALAHFGQRALTSDDLDQILTEACRRISEALGTDLAKVMELQDDGETLLVRAGVGWKPGVVGVARTNASDNTSEGHALKTGGPMISPDIEQERRFIYPAFLVDNGVKAVANVPIIGCKGERPYGVLQVDSRKPRQFTDSDTTFLTTYANLLAAAVTRLRVTRNLQEGERRLRRSEERLRRVTEIETVGVLFFDAAGRITDANAAFLRMSGLSREDIAAGRVHWEELTSPEWMPATLRALEQMKATGHGKPFEKQYVRKDGSRWWGLFAGRMLDDGGAVEFVLDVTDRKAADQALRASEARLRALVEGIPQLVFRSRSSGARIWGSSQWVNYTGLGEAQSLGLGWLDAVHPDDRAATLDAWQDAEAIGRVSIEHRTRRASDGAWRWFQTRAMPVRNESGHIIEWFGTSTDIDDQVRARDVLARNRDELEVLVAERTEALRQAVASLQAESHEREQAEATLRHLQKMEAVGQLTGGIAHDFNNMLQGIAGSLDMVRLRVDQGRTADVRRLLDQAHGAVGRAAGLTRRLLAFARRQRLEPKLVDPDAMMAGMADLIRRSVGPSIRLELRLRDGRARILCDPSELESALLNLCINARDSMADGGLLTLGTDDIRLSAAEAIEEGITPGDYVSISVTDTGRGMPKEVVERAFEPFFTTKPIGQGTGLGLSQVYGFVRQSGGLVQLESKPGVGTTVRLNMPTHQSQEGAEGLAKDPVQAPALSEKSVLLVEDEALARQSASERLRDLGYHVLEAADGPAALRLLDAGARIDLLVTDVGLPNGLNGRQVAEAIRERQPGIPVLFITGYAGTDLPPGSEVIDKPFDLDTLARRIQAALEAHR